MNPWPSPLLAGCRQYEGRFRPEKTLTTSAEQTRKRVEKPFRACASGLLEQEENGKQRKDRAPERRENEDPRNRLDSQLRFWPQAVFRADASVQTDSDGLHLSPNH